jgi:hypothetical protein
MATKKEEALEKDFTLNEKLAIIQTEFKSKKSRFNSFGKYNFRSAEDILEATKPFLLRLGISVTVTEDLIDSNQGFPILKSTATISDGNGAIHAVAIVGVDLDQKGMQMPQKFGSASSYGKKYALGNLFLIDDTQDADHGPSTPSPSTKQKVKITLDSDTFEKAKAYVKDQTTLDTILNKYDVDPKAIEALKKMINE